MSPQETLDRFRNIVVVNAQRTALEISQHLRRLPLNEQRQHFGGDYGSGYLYLYRHDSHPDKVMETVVSPQGEAITSIYINSPELATIGEVIKMRQALIRAIAERVGLSAGLIGVEDEGRGRQLGLAELSTGQLIDVLGDRMGSSVMVSSSIGGDADAVAIRA